MLPDHFSIAITLCLARLVQCVASECLPRLPGKINDKGKRYWVEAAQGFRSGDHIVESIHVFRSRFSIKPIHPSAFNIRSSTSPSAASPAAASDGHSTGRKSICSARANFAAVTKEMLTSLLNTFEMYGRDTFIRRAKADWFNPSCFIRRSTWRRKTDPILSIVFKRRDEGFEWILRRGFIRRE